MWSFSFWNLLKVKHYSTKPTQKQQITDKQMSMRNVIEMSISFMCHKQLNESPVENTKLAQLGLRWGFKRDVLEARRLFFCYFMHWYLKFTDPIILCYSRDKTLKKLFIFGAPTQKILLRKEIFQLPDLISGT